jgi:hypothetical protein
LRRWYKGELAIIIMEEMWIRAENAIAVEGGDAVDGFTRGLEGEDDGLFGLGDGLGDVEGFLELLNDIGERVALLGHEKENLVANAGNVLGIHVTILGAVVIIEFRAIKFLPVICIKVGDLVQNFIRVLLNGNLQLKIIQL